MSDNFKPLQLHPNAIEKVKKFSNLSISASRTAYEKEDFLLGKSISTMLQPKRIPNPVRFVRVLKQH